MAEVPETDANETGQPETEPELIATEEPEAEELPEVKIEPKPESVSEEAPGEEPVEESSETVLEPDFSPVTEEPAKEQSEETIIEEQKPETETTEEEEEKTVITEKAEVTAEQIIAQELHKANMEPVTLQEQPEIEQPKATYTDKDSDKKEKSAIPYLIATIIIVLLLCGGAILFIIIRICSHLRLIRMWLIYRKLLNLCSRKHSFQIQLHTRILWWKQSNRNLLSRRNRQRNLSKQKVNLPNNNQQLRHIRIPHPTR